MLFRSVKAQEKQQDQQDQQEQGSSGAAPTRPRGWAEGIPAELPALQTAAKIVHRARSAGGLEQLLAAADAAASAEDAGDWGGDLGRALLDLVVAAEGRDDDPETALRALLARTVRELEQGTGA